MAKTKPMAAAAAAKKQSKKGKGSMKGKNGPAAVAMKARGAAAAERSNPFEAIWSRRKFDVLGKKRKGEEIRTSRSRSEAIHKVISKTVQLFPVLDFWASSTVRFDFAICLFAAGEHSAQGVRAERQVVSLP
jgi:hypothetical protein